MSFTESGRLSQIQAQVRQCNISTAIARLQKPYCPPAQQINRPVGNSESGRLAAAANAVACCAPSVPTNNYVNCNTGRCVALPATRTIQTEGAYLASRIANCAVATEGAISAGGSSESQRLRRLQDGINNPDYTTNPDARFTRYQRFFPAPCPPAPNANNLPLTQPEFGCNQVNQFPYA